MVKGKVFRGTLNISASPEAVPELSFDSPELQLFSRTTSIMASIKLNVPVMLFFMALFIILYFTEFYFLIRKSGLMDIIRIRSDAVDR